MHAARTYRESSESPELDPTATGDEAESFDSTFVKKLGRDRPPPLCTPLEEDDGLLCMSLPPPPESDEVESRADDLWAASADEAMWGDEGGW